jgi:XTP/dITP diphosphohydrolase
MVFEGVCPGQIALVSAGEGGFGYDPIFLAPQLGRTMAEITDRQKDRVSHRGRAARKLARYLERGVR